MPLTNQNIEEPVSESGAADVVSKSFLNTHQWLQPVIVFAILLGVWEILSRVGMLDPFFMPPPSTLAQTLVELITEGFPENILLHTHILVTLKRSIIGYLIAVALAIPIGILIGYFQVLDIATQPFVTFGRSTAPISILPLFIAVFDIGEVSKIALITFACFWATVTNTIAGVKFVDPILLRAAQSMDTSRIRTFVEVILPAATPRIFAGLKVSLAIAFMVIVAAEMIATVFGLGALINEARTWFRTDITMVGMFVIGVIGYVASIGLDRLEHRLIPWSQASRSSE
ncbi:MAG: ABC transporter permease [marine bacterium B5-7]|nr:MAG: ABC transporter permease [marine bacterium B5-7]